MTKSFPATVKPHLLVWARETSGYALGSAAKKIGISEYKLHDAEAGNQLLTFRQLKQAANVYKRPLALFFLSDAPPRESSLHDFRLDPATADSAISPAVNIEIRRARQRRDEALELAQELDENVSPFTTTHLSLSDSTDAAAGRISDLIALPADAGRSWKDADTAMKERKAAIEALGVLVFETSRIPTSEMRGASLPFDRFPIMLVNGGDAPTGRSFTLMHELTHLLLRVGGVCDLAPTHGTSDNSRVESFCNAVAAAVLMPTSQVEQLAPAARAREWTLDELSDLSQCFRVSREAMLLRLVTLGRATQQYYFSLRPQFRQEYLRFKESQKSDGDGGPSPAIMAVRNLGRPFVRLVLHAYEGDRIGLATASDYLGVKVRHLDRIREVIAKTDIAA